MTTRLQRFLVYTVAMGATAVALFAALAVAVWLIARPPMLSSGDGIDAAG